MFIGFVIFSIFISFMVLNNHRINMTSLIIFMIIFTISIIIFKPSSLIESIDSMFFEEVVEEPYVEEWTHTEIKEIEEPIEINDYYNNSEYNMSELTDFYVYDEDLLSIDNI